MVDGLIHVTSLPNDYYHHEKVQHKLVGERSGHIFQLADKIKIKVAAVSIDDRKIDFEFVEKL
jgi:ribonuclease R